MIFKEILFSFHLCKDFNFIFFLFLKFDTNFVIFNNCQSFYLTKFANFCFPFQFYCAFFLIKSVCLLNLRFINCCLLQLFDVKKFSFNFPAE